jgi:hypothetical protein
MLDSNMRKAAQKRDLQAISSLVSQAIALRNITVEAEIRSRDPTWYYSLAEDISAGNTPISILPSSSN